MTCKACDGKPIRCLTGVKTKDFPRGLGIHLGLEGSKPRAPIKMREDVLSGVLKAIVEKTSNFSGAELEQLITRVKRNAFNRRNASGLEEQDFLECLQRVRIDRERREEMIRINLDYARRHTDDEEFLGQLNAPGKG